MQHEHAAAERVVEAAGHHIRLDDTATADVDTWGCPQVIGNGNGRPLFNLLAGDRENLRRGIEHLLRTTAACRDDRLLKHVRARRHDNREGGTRLDVRRALWRKADCGYAYGIGAVRQIDETEAAVCTAHGTKRGTASHRGFDRGILDRTAAFGIGHLTGNGTGLGGESIRSHGQRAKRDHGRRQNSSNTKKQHVTPREGGKTSRSGSPQDWEAGGGDVLAQCSPDRFSPSIRRDDQTQKDFEFSGFADAIQILHPDQHIARSRGPLGWGQHPCRFQLIDDTGGTTVPDLQSALEE